MRGRRLGDWRSIALELVERAATASDRDDLLPGVFETIERTVGIDSASVANLTDGSLFTWNKPELCQRLWRDRGDRYVREMLPLGEVAERSGGVVHDRDVLSLARRGRLRVYSEYMRALRANSCVLVPARSGRSLTHVISLSRHGLSVFRDADLHLLRAVRAALSIAARIQPGAAPPRTEVARRCGAKLTPREAEIVHYVARGLQNSEIAALCGSSPFTVRNQLVTIFRKMDVTTRAELAARAAVDRDD